MATSDDVMLRVSRDLRDKLRGIADLESRTMASVVEEAIELYRRRKLLQESGEALQKQLSNADLRNAFLSERETWLATSPLT